MPAAKLLSPRETGKFVAERSQHVSIDDGGVEVAAAMLAESFLEGQFSMASWKKEHLLPVRFNLHRCCALIDKTLCTCRAILLSVVIF